MNPPELRCVQELIPGGNGVAQKSPIAQLLHHGSLRFRLRFFVSEIFMPGVGRPFGVLGTRWQGGRGLAVRDFPVMFTGTSR